jgi:hypothetical protein
MAEWLTRGFDNAENQAKQYGSFTREFFTKSNEEARIRILVDEPVNIRDHFVKGENKWYTCTGDETCKLCAQGNKAQNHFIFQVIDRREYTSPANGKTYKDQVKIWRVGIKNLRLLKLKSNKSGPLSSYDLDVIKMGDGQQISWSFDVVTDTIKTKPVLPEGQELYNLEQVLAPPTLVGKVEEFKEETRASAIPWEDDSDD